MRSVRFLLPLALSAIAASANAGLLGSTVHVEYLYPGFSVYEDYGNVVVGAGVEIPNVIGGVLSLDLGDSSLAYTANTSNSFTSGNGFNGLRITPVSGAFTSAMDLGGGFNPVNVSIIGGALYLDYQGVPFSTGDVSNVGFGTNISNVPGPLAALPFAALALRRRKRA